MDSALLMPVDLVLLMPAAALLTKALRPKVIPTAALALVVTGSRLVAAQLGELFIPAR